MSRRLDIGVASYRNPERLRATLASIEQRSTTDWRCIIVHSRGAAYADQDDDDIERQTILIENEAMARNPRFVHTNSSQMPTYAGAVNRLFALAETEYIAYLDNDVTINTDGWDEQLCSYLDRFHEIGMIFPNGGAYMIPRGPYTEVLWSPGFAWVLNRMCMKKAGTFDETLGHQEEADYCQRVRMAGYRCAAAPEISVSHHATATNDPNQIERISAGVVNWVNKWNRYFNGETFNYHSANVTRFEDWPPNALYLEEYWKRQLPTLNDAPEEVKLDGREYDLIRVPRLKNFYRGRII